MTAQADPRGWVRAGFFALLPAAAVSGGLALAPLIAVAGIASARLSLLRQAFAIRPIPLLLLLIFTAWVALSAAWSSYAGFQGLRLILTLAPGLMLAAAGAANPKAARLTLAAGAAAFVVLVSLLAVEALLDLPLNRAASPDQTETWMLERNPGRGTTILIALTWPLAGWLFAEGGIRRLLSVAAPLISAVIAVQFHHLTNAVSFGVGLVAFACALAQPRLTLLAIPFALAFWMLAAPFLTPILFADPSFTDGQHIGWISRIEIWKYTSAHILDAPLFGHGLDASRTVTDITVVRGEPMRSIPLHPHSAPLQIWYETGAIGALLAAAALASGGWALSRRLADKRGAAAAAAAALGSIGLVASIGYGLWQEWWIATMCVSAGLVAAVARSARA